MLASVTGSGFSFGSAFLLGQTTSSWLSVWLTPIWVLSIGLIFGLVALAVFLTITSLISLTPLGKLADDSRRGRTVSLVLGVVISAILCGIFVPQAGDNRQMLILPLIVLGLAAGFAVVYSCWHRTRAELKAIAGEGVVPYLLGAAAAFTVVGLVATPFVEEPKQIIGSVWQVNLFSDGEQTIIRTLDRAPEDLENPEEAPFQKVPMDYVLFNVAEMTLTSDKTIVIADAATPSNFAIPPVRVNQNETVRYVRENRDAPPLPVDPNRVYMQNREIDPATVVIKFTSRPTVPEATSVVITAIGFFTLFLVYITLRQAAPRVSAVALATAKSEMAQPIYLLLLSIGIFGVLLFGFLPFNTLGEDIRLMKDSGVTLIMVLGMIQAVWSAGTSVSEEIEGRTALTVLSKPISRGAFLIGKYMGIMLTVLVLFAIISTVFLVVLSYKPIYDAREASEQMPTWMVGHEQLVTTVPALLLYFMETMAIGGIAVALATRVPMIANFVVCFVIYVIGNLTAPIVRSTAGENELVGFVGKLIAVVIPNLNTFNIQSAVDAGNPIPPIYLAGAFTYLFFFCVMILMLALLMFEDKDLA